MRTRIPELAQEIRKILRVPLQEQLKWRNTDEALRQWIQHCERAGVFVFQSSDVDPLEMRGFVIPDRIAPVILINSKDSRSARIFTLIHEFAHLVLGSEGISNLNIPARTRNETQRIEVFCNAVAAEMLVPSEHFKAEVKAIKDWEHNIEKTVFDLSRVYSVSREVTVRRLTDSGFTTREFYRQMREQLRDEFERISSPKGKEHRVPYARIVLRNNGRAFARLVLSAYGENFITGRDVSSLLNIKLNHYARLEAEVFPSKTQRKAE